MPTLFRQLSLPTWPLAWILCSPFLFSGFVYASDPQPEPYQVFLQSNDQAVSLKIADLVLQQHGDHATYQVTMHEAQFGDYFLSMRPFKCMTDKASMLCHLAYPYPIERRISADNLNSLEHDFLFIRRKPTDYGIDPWHGLVYKLEKKGAEYVGVAHEVDLNILAVPPETDQLPLLEAEVHEIDGDSLWLPRLLVKPQ